MKTNNLIKKTTSIFITLCLILLASVGLFSIFNKSSIEAMAANEITISNKDFINHNSSTGAPNSFTSSSSVDDANVKAGVIDTSKPEYQKYRIGTLKDNYVLRISTNERDEYDEIPSGKNHSTYFGYDTTSSIALDAGKNYRITVDVYTDTSAGIGALYLKDGDNNDAVLSKITNVNSYLNWHTYTFLIKTDDIKDLNVKLGLYLNGSGTILFDSLSCFEMADSDFATRLENTNERQQYLSQYKVIKEISAESHPFVIKNTAENTLAEYVNVKATDESYDGSNTTAFKINNKEIAFNEYSTSEKLFFDSESEKNLIEQNAIYKVSVKAKAVGVSGNAVLKLTETNKDKSETITFSGTVDFTNYSFYVRTNTDSSDINFKLTVGLGEEGAKAIGTIYISKITLSKISYSTFNSTPSNVKKLDLVETSETDLLDNGAFNDFRPSDTEKSYPITPASWTVSSVEGEKQLYGIINTATAEFDKLKNDNKNISNFVNPDRTSANNNVLMMYSQSASPLSYTSASKSIQASTSNTFTMKVQVLSGQRNSNDSFKIELVTKKDDGELVLASTNIAPSLSVSEFKVVKFILSTAYQNCDVCVKLTLNSTTGTFAYVDDVHYYNSEKDSTADITVRTDLKNLYEYGNKIDDYYEAKNFSKSTGEGSYSGIVNLNETLSSHIIDSDHMASLKNLSLLFNAEDSEAGFVHNNNVFAIRNDYNFNTNNVYSTNLGYRLEQNKFYRLIVYVYTTDLQIRFPDSQNEEDTGVTLSMTGFTKSFEKIKTDNNWERYVFYINPTSTVDASYLQFALGSSDSQYIGRAFFGDINFKEIEEDEFVSADSSKVMVLQQTETVDDDTDNETDDADNESNFNTSAWLYAIPSIIFALAIIICVVGVIARKTKWKKPVKKTKNDYDRNKTVSKQYYARKATTVRDEKLRELNKELESLTNERSQYEEEYKHDLTKLRELKIKRAPQNEIVKLEKEMKKNQRLSSALGVNINNINDEITYTKSEQYYSQLIKKLMSEPNAAEVDNSKEEVDNKEANEDENKK